MIRARIWIGVGCWLVVLGLLAGGSVALAQSCGGVSNCIKGGSAWACAGGPRKGQDCEGEDEAFCTDSYCKASPVCYTDIPVAGGTCGSPTSCSATCPVNACHNGNTCYYIPSGPTNTPPVPWVTNTPAPDPCAATGGFTCPNGGTCCRYPPDTKSSCTCAEAACPAPANCQNLYWTGGDENATSRACGSLNPPQQSCRAF